MTDHRALVAAMVADPADDTVRLAYADYLEENGEGERAELVRVQVELARMNVNDPERRPFVVRNRELLNEHGPAWRARLPRLPGIEWGDFSRGLVEEVHAADAAAVVKHAGQIFTEPAVHVLRITRLPEARTLAALPDLNRIRSLRLISSAAHEDTIRDLISSPHLKQLIALDLHGNRAGDDTATDVADGRFPALAELWLGANRIGDRGAQGLTVSAHLGALRILDLRGNPIRHSTVRADLRQRFGRVVKLS